MKRKFLDLIFFLALILSSCSNEGDVNIVSLNSFGTKFCRNDRVKVFVAAKTDGNDLPTYKWGCDGGEFTNPQGLFENLWVAPNEPGEYEIWVTVECSGSKETRRSKMVVLDELFYSDFERPYFSEDFKTSGITVKQDLNLGCVSLEAKGDDAYFRKDFPSVMGIKSPLSMQFENTFTKALPSSTCSLFYNFTDSEIKPAISLKQIKFNYSPYSGTYQLACSAFDNTSLQFIEYVEDEAQLDLLKGVQEKKRLSLSVNSSNKILVYCNGQKILESDLLSKIGEESFLVQSVGVELSRNSLMLLDNLLILDNGQVCQANDYER